MRTKPELGLCSSPDVSDAEENWPVVKGSAVLEKVGKTDARLRGGFSGLETGFLLNVDFSPKNSSREGNFGNVSAPKVNFFELGRRLKSAS